MEFMPLSNRFFIAGFFGFLISLLYIMTISTTWGITFMFIFGAMLVSSVISTFKAPVEYEIHRDIKADVTFLSKEEAEEYLSKKKVTKKNTKKKITKKRKK